MENFKLKLSIGLYLPLRGKVSISSGSRVIIELKLCRSLQDRLCLLAIINVSPIQQTLQLENLLKVPYQLQILYAVDVHTFNHSKG